MSSFIHSVIADGGARISPQFAADCRAQGVDPIDLEDGTFLITSVDVAMLDSQSL